MEDEARQNDPKKRDLPSPTFMSPVVEWWVQNFSLVSDFVTRRYPLYMVAYDAVLNDPEATLHGMFDWLGRGNVEAAIAAVDPALRTQDAGRGGDDSTEDTDLPHSCIETFDALYSLVVEQRALEQSFVDLLNETNEALVDVIEHELHRIAKHAEARRRKVQPSK
jgi:hypothetical protein